MKSTKSSFGPNAQNRGVLIFSFCLSGNVVNIVINIVITCHPGLGPWTRRQLCSVARRGRSPPPWRTSSPPSPPSSAEAASTMLIQHELHHYFHSPGVELVIRNGAPKGRLAVHHLGIPMIKMTIMLRTAMIKMTIILICCNDIDGEDNNNVNDYYTGCFFNWYPPKKLKYVKPRLGESTLT